MCEECESGYMQWQWSDRLSAFVIECSGCGYADEASATQDESVMLPFLEM